MPVLLEVANERADLQFVIAGAPHWMRQHMHLSICLPMCTWCMVRLMHFCSMKAALVTSGTATLRPPCLVFPGGMLSWQHLSYWIARRLVKVRFISPGQPHHEQ